jgi:SAM-dependent methyltransferase
MKLYTDLSPWYSVIDPHEDHAAEAHVFTTAFDRVITPRAETLLELGAGAGHNIVHLKERYRCTHTDISEPMQDLSRALNPECEHALGDMRALRLGRTFDAVLAHDGIVYMLTRDDLRAAIETAYVHLRPGGAAIFAPDGVRDGFEDESVLLECDRGERAMRGVQWTWDPDPSDETVQTDYAFVLREGLETTVAHDVHISGLFHRATWLELLASVGFRSTELIERPIDDEGRIDRVFLAIK